MTLHPMKRIENCWNFPSIIFTFGRNSDLWKYERNIFDKMIYISQYYFYIKKNSLKNLYKISISKRNIIPLPSNDIKSYMKSTPKTEFKTFRKSLNIKGNLIRKKLYYFKDIKSIFHWNQSLSTGFQFHVYFRCITCSCGILYFD